MKLRIALLILLAALVLAAPAAAKQHEPVGLQISLLAGDQTFPEGAPFHMKHGWMPTPGWMPMGLWSFELEVDGQSLREDFVLRTLNKDTSPPQFTLYWLFNFPEGMSGTHTFTGRWLAPCQYLEDQGLIEGPCAKANEIMMAATRTILVTFE